MQTRVQREYLPINERGSVLKPFFLASIMSLNPSHHLFHHFLSVIGNMSKHPAAEVMGTVFGLRGTPGAVAYSGTEYGSGRCLGR